MSLKRRILSNTAYQVSAYGINALAGLTIVYFLSRGLGVAGFGRYALIFVYLYFSQAVSTAGLDPVLTRDLAARPERAGSLLGSVLVLRFSLAAAALGLMAAFLWVREVPADFRGAVLLAHVSLFLSGLDVVESLFKARLEMRFVSAISVASQLLHLGLVLSLVSFGAGLVPLAGAYVAARGVRTALSWAAARRRYRISLGVDRATLRYLGKEALPLGVSALLWMIYFRADQVMLEMLSGVRQVAYYNAGYRFLDVSLLLSGMIMASLYPLMSPLYPHDRPGLQRVFAKAFDYAVFLGSFVAVALLLGAEPIVKLLYGPEFGPAAAALRWLSLSCLVLFPSNVLAHMLFVTGMERAPLLTLRALAAALNIGLNLWWIPLWGALGAVWATLSTEGLLLILVAAVIRRREGLRPRVRTAAHTLVGLAGGYALYALTGASGASIGLGLAFFFAVQGIFLATYYRDFKELLARRGRPAEVGRGAHLDATVP